MIPQCVRTSSFSGKQPDRAAGTISFQEAQSCDWNSEGAQERRSWYHARGATFILKFVETFLRAPLTQMYILYLPGTSIVTHALPTLALAYISAGCQAMIGRNRSFAKSGSRTAGTRGRVTTT
ncbi:hypothetical protein NDU88_007984 [Pleurodeles waltl]|uniref:Uncharacterized protein n=1 Tax=Pleurodeles waltl TaxID=8319 RepID=A0AAV7PT16_PLEWA|nr:hypothetical protein NDU88_007984 [Pleurodeles waltl]